MRFASYPTSRRTVRIAHESPKIWNELYLHLGMNRGRRRSVIDSQDHACENVSFDVQRLRRNVRKTRERHVSMRPWRRKRDYAAR